MPATAGRVPMPAGNRVTTSSALKVSDRWASVVGEDPYKSEEKGEDMMKKLWADQRLHGQSTTGADKREMRKHEGLAARDAEFERMKERKRAAAAELETGGGEQPSKKLKKDKKDKKDKKEKKKKEKEKKRKHKSKKDKKEKKDKKDKKEKKKRKRSESDSESDDGSESGSESGSDEE